MAVVRGDRVITSIPVGKRPLRPAVAPDGTVYVPNQVDGTVSIIREDRVTKTIHIRGEDPRQPVIATDGTVYVAGR